LVERHQAHKWSSKVSLRVEKIIAAGSEGVVNVRALAPGRWELFDDFHQATRGVLDVQ
jgi:hypothetical protein